VQKLYELTNEAEQDIPTTVPIKTPYAQWQRLWFENPATLLDRVWIAREGDAIVGLSVIGYPPQRGFPWTQLTATSRRVRGRGIARALKYATVAQAIELGVQHIRTSNDGENAPILHINAEMGYKPLQPEIELHRELAR
jgi:GNAT superfamily N-acetyltransferase